ncbi:uncharacterized protein LOC122386732 [Amphibalanus amphitrite]|uniref:uncharacterized protein LOC122386732 n=1 Tax=Amphibalanus amphitrite TaxID=1232801 RepID=UPI001C91E9D5|nr:uncharacterized protein LOC122386732 [Amphibalanus amphitrite]
MGTHAAIEDGSKRFASPDRYTSISPPRLSQLSPSSSLGSPPSPHGSPLSAHLSLSPQLCPAVCPQLSPSRELPQLSERQLSVLEASFLVNRNPRHSDLLLLGAELEMDQPQIKRWFCHRLACWRQEQGLQPNGRRVDMITDGDRDSKRLNRGVSVEVAQRDIKKRH